jgi:hypothetical protein
MSKYFGGNEKRQNKKFVPKASEFAKEVLASVGGSCVYIEPKKGLKQVDMSEMT